MLKSIFSAKREAAPYYIMRARAKGERHGKRRAGRANGKRGPDEGETHRWQKLPALSPSANAKKHA